MANQSNEARKVRGPKAAKSGAKPGPVVRVSSKAAKHKKTTKTHVVGGIAFVVSQRRQRTQLVMAEAKKVGLLGGPKNTVIRGRVPDTLVKEAKKRAGVSSDTELLEVALSSLALEDDFGDKLLGRKGSIDPDIDLEF